MENIRNRKTWRKAISVAFLVIVCAQPKYGQTIAEYVNSASIVGYSCSAFGNSSLFSNTTTNGANTGLGFEALYLNATGNNCTALGSGALYNNEPGNDNTATGVNALFLNDYGEENTAIGVNSLLNNSSGRENTTAGYLAGFNNSTGIDNTAFGSDADFANNYDDNQCAIGYNAQTNSSDMIRLGNTSIATFECQVALTVTSDGRLKYNVKENEVKGIDFICALRPVVYNFDNQKQSEFMRKQATNQNEIKQSNEDFMKFRRVRRSGFIAQEVEMAAANCQFNFDGIKTPKSDKDYYGLSYGQFVVPLIKAVKEQQDLIDLCKRQLDNLELAKTEVNEDFDLMNYSNANSMIKFERIENSDEILISIPPAEIADKTVICVYSSVGKQLKANKVEQTNNAYKISCSDLPVGKYILTVNSNGLLQSLLAFEKAGVSTTK